MQFHIHRKTVHVVHQAASFQTVHPRDRSMTRHHGGQHASHLRLGIAGTCECEHGNREQINDLIRQVLENDSKNSINYDDVCN
jgi:hypothetical protein